MRLFVKIKIGGKLGGNSNQLFNILYINIHIINSLSMDYLNTYQNMLEYDISPVLSFDDPTFFCQGVSAIEKSWGDNYLTNEVFSAQFFPDAYNPLLAGKVVVVGNLSCRQIAKERSLPFPALHLPKE